eukprot:10834982-Karenia_brevis.AAC.1
MIRQQGHIAEHTQAGPKDLYQANRSGEEKGIISALCKLQIHGINILVQIHGQQAKQHLPLRQIHGQHGMEPTKMKVGLTAML